MLYFHCKSIIDIFNRVRYTLSLRYRQSHYIIRHPYMSITLALRDSLQAVTSHEIYWKGNVDTTRHEFRCES